jgi:hypothetical protein
MGKTVQGPADVTVYLGELNPRITPIDRQVGYGVDRAAIGGLSRFPTAAHLAAWTGLVPAMNESAGKQRPAGDYAELDGLAHDRVWAWLFRAIFFDHGPRSWHGPPHWPLTNHSEILDYASAEKPDVSSGTSRELAETLAEVRTPQSAVPLSQMVGPVEARDAEVAGTRIHSVRLPSFVVTTEIVFGGAGERLVMRHDPGESPDRYVAGTLLANRKAADVPGVRRGLDSLLIDEPPAAEAATWPAGTAGSTHLHRTAARCSTCESQQHASGQAWPGPRPARMIGLQIHA